MDEERQADGTEDGAEAAAWGQPYRGNHAWSSAGEALEPAAEPLALLTSAQHSGEEPTAGQRRYAPGLDDDTPVGGLPAAAEPPLWREAARYSPGYGSQPAEYQPVEYQPAEYQPAEYQSALATDLYGIGEQRPPEQRMPERPPASAAELRPPEQRPPQPVEPAVLPQRTAPPTEPVGLPQRVPAEPDVPDVPDSGAGGRDRWTAPELAWIADQLKRDDVPQVPSEGLDVDAVLEAVREVPGVRSASVRPNPTGVHTLRLDLADDADPGDVSRVVARLLEERMGLSAAPQGPPVPPPRTAPPGPEPITPRPAQTAPAPPPVHAAPAPPPVHAAPAPPPVQAPPAPPPRPAEPPPPPPSPPPQYVPPPPSSPPPPSPSPAMAETEQPAAEEPEVVSRPLYPPQPGLRVVIEEVRVNIVGFDATVEVQLTAGERRAHGAATGPAVDSYVDRLAAVAAANAIDGLLRQASPAEPTPGTASSRCFVEHTGVVPFGSIEVAVVVLLLVCGGWVEQLTGSALVDGDPRQAMVRATLGAVNRRLEALLG